MIIGTVFFFLRFVLCIIFMVHSLENQMEQMKYFWPSVYAIIFGIGALSDIVLVLGAWRKNIKAIWFWNISQVLLGGIPCCIAIPIVTLKAIEEIKQESLNLVRPVRKKPVLTYTNPGGHSMYLEDL